MPGANSEFSDAGDNMTSVNLDITHAIAVLTIDRPGKANAVTPDMAVQLADHCRVIDERDDVRVAILTGSGTNFSAGSDLGTLDDYSGPWAFRSRVDYCDAVFGLRKPLIAAVNGPAIGGGLEMALSADIRIAGPRAVFSASEVGLGWIGGGGASQLLPRLVGAGNAALALLTGQQFDAEEAFRLGLVQRLAGGDDCLQVAREVAGVIAANAPIAVQAMKAAMRAAQSMSLVDGMQYEEELVAVCMGTSDRNEGIAAFRERRPPRFEGR